jgi:hypothetical protein
MIDKKISLGTILTLGTIIGTFIYTQGVIATKMDAIASDGDDNKKTIMSSREKVQTLEVSVAKIETKIDEGFKNLENFLLENY